MKKIILTLVSLSVSTYGFSQNDSIPSKLKDGIYQMKTDTVPNLRDGNYQRRTDSLTKLRNGSYERRTDSIAKLKDGVYQTRTDSIPASKTCVTMTNGKLMVLKDGVLVPMEDAMVMENGTIVMLSGMIKTREGRVTQMNEGDCLNMFGDMIPLHDSKMQNDSHHKNR